MNGRIFGLGIISIACILSAVNLMLLIGLWQAKQALSDAVHRAANTLTQEVGQQIAPSFNTTIAVDTMLDVPIKITVPIKTTVRVPVSVPLVGQTTVTVPIDTTIPIDTVVRVPIKASVPVYVASGNLTFGNVVKQIQELLANLATML